VRQGIEPQPREQETGTDKRLQEQPKVVESVFPAGIIDPGRMLQGRGRRGRRRRVGSCGRQGWSLQTHKQVGAQHLLPPALDTGSIGEAEIGTAQFILGVLKALLDSGS